MEVKTNRELKLKPCPFCGADARVRDATIEEQGSVYNGNFFKYCGCPNYCVEMFGYTPEEAIKKWNTRTNKRTQQKKRKYYRKCGVCGERHEQSEMLRTINSPNGWLCFDCYFAKHPEYEDFGEE